MHTQIPTRLCENTTTRSFLLHYDIIAQDMNCENSRTSRRIKRWFIDQFNHRYVAAFLLHMQRRLRYYKPHRYEIIATMMTLIKLYTPDTGSRRTRYMWCKWLLDSYKDGVRRMERLKMRVPSDSEIEVSDSESDADSETDSDSSDSSGSA
jgi:hypothetical protein